jgi:tetratricopeptide (TPR) repeat protein
MIRFYPVTRSSTVLLGILTGLLLLLSAGVTEAVQVEVPEAERREALSRYEAAMAEGDRKGAVKHILELTEKMEGENSPLTVKLTHRYGHLLYQDGEYRDATKVLNKALKRSTAAFGETGGEAFEINMNIAYSYSQWSPSLSSRMKHFDQALEILREQGEHESMRYVTTLVNIVVNLMDNDGLSGDYSTELGLDYERYMEDELTAFSPEQEYRAHHDKARKYIVEAAELAGKLEDVDEYLSAKIAIAQAKLNVMETADLLAVPIGVRGRMTRGTAKKRNDVEEDRLMTAIDKLSEDIENNRIFLNAANKGLMEIAWLEKDRTRMDTMCANGTLNSASEYHPDRLYRVEEDGSVIAPQFSFRVTNNIFKSVVRDEQQTDKNGNPVKRPYFMPVCIDGRLMAALTNAPRVVIEEFVD